MIKKIMLSRITFLLLGMCWAFSGRLYGAPTDATQKEKNGNHQGGKKPQQVAKAAAPLQSEQSDFYQFYKIPKEQMATKAYQDLFLYAKQQEAEDEQRYPLAKEVYMTQFHHLPEAKREKAVYNKIFFLQLL